MSEGILPTNEGRGYVLRRIIRRALLHCHKLNKNVLILSNLIDNVIQKYSNYYFELNKARTFVNKNLFSGRGKIFRNTSNRTTASK